jgi:hypothetical protein
MSEYKKKVFTRRPSGLTLYQTDYASERTQRNVMFQ